MASCSGQAVLGERRVHLEEGGVWPCIPTTWNQLKPWEEVKHAELTFREQRLEHPGRLRAEGV